MNDDCKEAFLPPTDKTRYGHVVDVGDECYIKTEHAPGSSTQHYPISGFDAARTLSLRNECKPRTPENFCSDRVIDPETGGPMCYDFKHPDPKYRTIPGTRKILGWPSTRIGMSVGSCYQTPFYHQKGSGFGPLDDGPYLLNNHSSCNNYQHAKSWPDGTWYYYYTGKLNTSCHYSMVDMIYDEESSSYYKSGQSIYTQWPMSWKNTLTDRRHNVSTVWGYNCSASLWSSWLELHFPYPVTLLPGKYVAHATKAHGTRTSGKGCLLYTSPSPRD